MSPLPPTVRRIEDYVVVMNTASVKSRLILDLSSKTLRSCVANFGIIFSFCFSLAASLSLHTGLPLNPGNRFLDLVKVTVP